MGVFSGVLNRSYKGGKKAGSRLYDSGKKTGRKLTSKISDYHKKNKRNKKHRKHME